MGVYWSASNRPVIGAMHETLLLTDASSGDTTTGQYSQQDIAIDGGFLCHTVTAETYLTAQSLSANVLSLSGWSARGSLVVGLSSVGAACVESPGDPSPPEGGDGELVLEAWVEGAWVEVATAALTAPELGDLLTQTQSFNVSGSISPTISSCDVRLVARFSYTKTGNSTTLSVRINLTDWRLTSSDSGTPCTDNSTGETGGGGETGGSGSCGCASWRPKGVCTASWTPKRCA